MKRRRSVLQQSTDPTLSAHASKKLKLLADHTVRSPFPDFLAPSAQDALAVHALLASLTPGGAPVYAAPAPTSNSAQTCGHTPNVLDALIGTILSQNTSAANSTAAKRELDRVFGQGEPGFERMATADRQTLAETIRSGGLANRKAAAIQGALVAVKKTHGRYDLQHLAAPGMSDECAMQALVALNGVGPKTAACVLSLCLGRQAFAVDTHVFRLSKLLGWVPKSAARVAAQAHLELKIPPELKYGLHVMMWTLSFEELAKGKNDHVIRLREDDVGNARAPSHSVYNIQTVYEVFIVQSMQLLPTLYGEWFAGLEELGLAWGG